MTTTDTPLTDPQADAAVVAEVYAAFGRGDLARIAELFADDVVLTQSPALPWGGTHTGPSGLAALLGTLRAHLESTPVTEQLFADGAGRVVQVGRTRGTVRANGAAFDVPEVHVWTVAGGRVQRLEAYLDTPALREAMDRPAP